MKAKPKKKSAAPKSKSPAAGKTKKAPPARRAPAAKKKAKKSKPPAAKAKRKVATPRAKPRAKAAAKAPPGRPKPKAKAKAPARRDATGHLAPKYAAGLRALSKQSRASKDAASFVKGSKSQDPLAEGLGEGFVQSALSGEDSGEETLDQVVDEESGGPFVETSSKTEFGRGTDASNPRGAFREPFPTS